MDQATRATVDAEILDLALRIQDIVRSTYETQGMLVPFACLWLWREPSGERRRRPTRDNVTQNNKQPYSGFLQSVRHIVSKQDGVGGIMVRVEPKGPMKSVVIQVRLTTGADLAWRAPLDPTQPRPVAIGPFTETPPQADMRVTA